MLIFGALNNEKGMTQTATYTQESQAHQRVRRPRAVREVQETQPMCGLDEALDDVEHGRVYHTKDLDDLFEQLGLPRADV